MYAGVNVHLCILVDVMKRFKVWSSYIDIHVMQVYTVGADGHVSSHLSGLSEKIKNILRVLMFYVLL